jgi:transposase
LVSRGQKQAELRGCSLSIMFQDESRFGRINDIKRCWAASKIRPEVAKQIIREYMYIYGAFDPMDGTADMLILPSMTLEAMNVFLKELSIRHKDKFILLICDGASNHRTESLKLPDNIMIEYLPPTSPQLNPSENMWDEMKEKFFHNRIFNSFENLVDRMVESILHYEKNKEIVKSITGWHWIVNPINSILNPN